MTKDDFVQFKRFSYLTLHTLHCRPFPTLILCISSHLLPMELYARRLLPSLPRHLFIIILTACCASLFPCYLCLDLQYQYCQNTRTCGRVTDICYPLGVGNRGCGHPHFQIDCVQNLSPVITIQGHNYTIIERHFNFSLIVRGEKCKFLDDPIHMQIPHPGRTDTIVISDTENRTLNVYNCNNEPQLNNSRMVNGKCNATVYYGYKASLHLCKASLHLCRIKRWRTRFICVLNSYIITQRAELYGLSLY